MPRGHGTCGQEGNSKVSRAEHVRSNDEPANKQNAVAMSRLVEYLLRQANYTGYTVYWTWQRTYQRKTQKLHLTCEIGA
jgi:hypothetical protein